MFPMILTMLLTALLGQEGPAKNDAQLLIDTIEALQQPIEDFRCEFEGTNRFMGKVAESFKVTREDGLYESFSGVFIWKRGGDIHYETWNRRASDNQISRESVVMRMRQRQAEEYYRLNDEPLGYAVIKKPEEVRPDLHNCLAFIFLIDNLKRDIAQKGLDHSVSDNLVDGRPLKVLNIGIKGVPDSLIARYWIDLRRNGHVVRRESYRAGKVMSGRLDIKLAPFEIGDTEVWMPVSGESVGYEALGEDKIPIVTKEPTSIRTIYVVNGTMEFNKHPGPEAFTIKYKMGTPISDNLRKLEYEFGQQKIGLNPTKAEAEKMLNEQLAQAEAQKAELVVASPSEGFDWTRWLAWGFGALALIASVLLWLQRRGH
jgi:hypothetical protein